MRSVDAERRWAEAPSFATILCGLTLLMPFASGLRGISPDGGRLALLSCDLILFALFAIVVMGSKFNLVTGLTVYLAIYSVVYALLSPSFPDLMTTYQGIRKSILWLCAIGIGAALNRSDLKRVIDSILISCTIVCLYGIKQYFVLSDFDRTLLAAQSASEYANKIGGLTRAISLLSSGFHLGMAGCLTIILVLTRRPLRPFWSAFLIGIALMAVYASLTRTFLVIAIVLLLTMLPRWTGLRLLFAVTVAVLALIVAYLFNVDVVLDVIDRLASDDRFANRSSSYSMFSHYMSTQPFGWVFGFGPGSAGSTLGVDYLQNGHPWIEPHNVFIKYIFEFGVGNALILFIALGYLVYAPRSPISVCDTAYDMTRLSRAGIMIIILAGLTITSVETWPIAVYIGIIVGSAVARSQALASR